MSFKNSSGFTTFELMVVGIVAIIVFSVAVPTINRSMAASKLSSAALQLATDLEFARSAAMSRNSIYRLQLFTAEDMFQVIDAELGDLLQAPRELERGISILSTPANPIRFFSRGYARGGTVTLQNEFGETITVTVRPSGMVEVGDYVQAQEL